MVVMVVEVQVQVVAHKVAQLEVVIQVAAFIALQMLMVALEEH